MKFLVRAAVAGLAAGLVLLAVLWHLWTAAGADTGGGVVKVRVPQGATWVAASDSLVRHRLLDHPVVLRLGVRLLGRESELRAGLYALARGSSPRSLVAALTKGTTVPVRLTLPEGWNATEVADEVARRLGFSAGAFLATADSLVRKLESGDRRWPGAASLIRCDSLQVAATVPGTRTLHICEGYLAPDTYLFAEGSSPVEVAGLLVATQLKRLAHVDSLAQTAVSLDPHQTLTLASIVESEARLPREQPLIAAVYRNRLAQGWKLEADPTVAFLLDRKGRRLYQKDLSVDSPYNTYRYPGLPPGPIGNPGLGALLAAVRPDSTCRAMFFVSNGAGGHVFSRTAAEHAKAVANFRKIRARTRGGQVER